MKLKLEQMLALMRSRSSLRLPTGGVTMLAPLHHRRSKGANFHAGASALTCRRHAPRNAPSRFWPRTDEASPLSSGLLWANLHGHLAKALMLAPRSPASH